MKKYRIHWKALKTGATGHGKPVFEDKEMAKTTARELNIENKGITHHWVEEVEVTDD